MAEHHQSQLGLLPKLKHALSSFIAENKRDNENKYSGWHQRLQNIYLSLSQEDEPNNLRHHSWKKYEDR